MQPHQSALVAGVNQGQGGVPGAVGNSNRRVGGVGSGVGNNNSAGPAQQGFDQNAQATSYNAQSIQNLPPAQQQALIAAQLTYAMAAAAQGNLNMPGQMFDNQGAQNKGGKEDRGINNQGNANNANSNNNNSNSNDSRRQFARRGGNNSRGGGREESYPYDAKRARY